MGRSFAVTTVVELQYEDGHKDFAHPAWSRKTHGVPSDANLANFVRVWNDAYAEGGVNYHGGTPIKIVGAKVVNQRSGNVQAEWIDYNHKARVSCEAREVALLEKARAV